MTEIIRSETWEELTNAQHVLQQMKAEVVVQENLVFYLQKEWDNEQRLRSESA